MCQNWRHFFETKKALRDNPGSNESVEISESGEQLLQEDSSTLEAADLIKLQEVVSRQYMDYIRDLEEDRFSLRSRVAELEAENTKLGQEVEEVQGGLEAKSERICQLRESLNVTNDKHSRLLREDLEKNYRIIELEGKIEDLEAENERLKLNYEELMGTVETLRRDAFLDSDEVKEPFIEDKNLKNEIAMLDKDVSSLKEQLALNGIVTKRNRKSSTTAEQEFFKMRTLKTLSKSAKKKRRVEIKNPDPRRRGEYVMETTFCSDSSSSSPERTIVEESSTPRRGSFFRSLVRTSVRSSNKYIPGQSSENCESNRVRKFAKQVEDCKQQ